MFAAFNRTFICYLITNDTWALVIGEAKTSCHRKSQ